LKSPTYIHNCPSCYFLGQFKQADLYACLKNGKPHSFVARTGNRPDTYISGGSVRDIRLRRAKELWETQMLKVSTTVQT